MSDATTAAEIETAGKGLGAVVVGTGFGFLTHMRALREAGYEVHALVGRDPEKTRARAERGGVPHGLTDLDAALALPGVDVVTIATPPHTHAEIARAACAAGKHVVCEKPLARDANEAEAMWRAAEEAGVHHAVGTEFRWSTPQAVATRALRAGRIGEPRLATFLLHQGMLADPNGEVPSWWSDAGEGGGWLGAYASHVIDQVRLGCGEIRGVSASLRVTSKRDWSAEDTYSIHFRTDRGCEGVMQSTAGAWGPGLGLTRIAGSEGTLWIDGADVKVSGPSGEETLDVPLELALPAPKPPDRDLLVTSYDMMHAMGIDLAPFARLFARLAHRIRGSDPVEDPPFPTFLDGARVMAVLDAIRASSREERWVEVKPIG
ncbi:MAG: Gfo/Idh/MocA family oxidoreductase [Myxococcota bacterium]